MTNGETNIVLIFIAMFSILTGCIPLVFFLGIIAVFHGILFNDNY